MDEGQRRGLVGDRFEKHWATDLDGRELTVFAMWHCTGCLGRREDDGHAHTYSTEPTLRCQIDGATVDTRAMITACEAIFTGKGTSLNDAHKTRIMKLLRGAPLEPTKICGLT